MKKILHTCLLTLIALSATAQCVEQKYGGVGIRLIRMKTPQIGVAMDELQSYIYTTTNGGITWKPNATNLQQSNFVNSLEALNDSMFISNYGGIPKFKNFGEQLKSTNNIPSFKVYFYTAKLGFSLTYTEYLLKSVNEGETWKKIDYGIFKFFYDINFATPLVGYIVGQEGNIRKSKDGGESWRAANSGADRDLRVVKFVSPTIGWVAGDGGYLAKTIDGGDSFEQQIKGVNINFYGLTFLDSLTGYAVGSLGAMFRTLDGGKNWIKIKTNTFEALYSISCPSKDTCWASGAAGTIIKYVTPTAITGVEESTEGIEYTLFPNPADNHLSLAMSVPSIANLSIVLQDLLGKELQVLTNSYSQEIHQTIDISTYPQGLYAVSYYLNGIKQKTNMLCIK